MQSILVCDLCEIGVTRLTKKLDKVTQPDQLRDLHDFITSHAMMQ